MGGTRSRSPARRDMKVGEEAAQVALAEKCLERFEATGYGNFSSVASVSCRVIQGLWAGTGSVVDLAITSPEGERRSIIVKKIGPPDDPEEHEGKRDHESFYVEASFYDQGHAERVLRAGAVVPQHLLTERLDGGYLNICMTRLTGNGRGRVDSTRARAGLAWLAKLHALYWGSGRADSAVASGLQSQGCYWHFDTRQLEFGQMPSKGWQGRLRLAAAGLDARLKADSMQTVCHGDPKGANVFFDDEDVAQFFDFQWIGKAPPAKDLAYFMACGASPSNDEDEVTFLRHYHAELSELLRKQGDEPPTFEKLWDSYVLSVCDLGRWMAGWGWWGNVRLLQGHAREVLERLDGGTQLESEQAYKDAIFNTFPV